IDSGIIDETTSYDCTGEWQITPTSRVFHCHRESGHGTLKVVDALAQSCNVFIYNTGYSTGVELLSQTAQDLGLGRQTEIGLPYERSGSIPDSIWRANRGSPWYPGETVLFGIGQGPMSVTPLQVVSVYQTIAMEGKRYRPR